MSCLKVKVGNIELQNPIMPASGTFSEGILEVINGNELGAFVTKTFTADVRTGNPMPRIAEIESGSMLNAIGIPSKGVNNYIEKTVPIYRDYTPPLVTSISANTAAEFAELAAQLCDVDGISVIEANISCPNIEAHGKAFAIDPESTAKVISAIRKATHLPVWAKLTPNTTDIIGVAKAVEDNGGDAVVVGNTLLGMGIDIRTKRPKLGNIMGGYSGAGLKAVNLRMTYQCAKNISIPVIGCGGINNYEDVIEYLLAGATAVQVGTASFIDPKTMTTIIKDLERYCSEQQLKHISQLTGAVIDDQFAPFTAFE